MCMNVNIRIYIKLVTRVIIDVEFVCNELFLNRRLFENRTLTPFLT